ncbi:MAG: hypothetical protein ACOCUY_01370 [Verrucomicrobiota bacterium]
MNFDKINNLSNKQKQQLMLTVIVIGGLLYASYEFGIKPIRQQKQETLAEIEAMETQLGREQQLLNTKESTAKDYRKTRDEIRQVMSEHIAPYENALSWATRVINDAAANVGIKETNLAISEQGRSGTPLIHTKGRDEKPELLNVFRVGVSFSADYHTLGRFIAAIERNNPHVHLGMLSIDSQARRDDHRLEVKIDCVFPRFSRKVFPITAHPDEPLPVPPSTDNE